MMVVGMSEGRTTTMVISSYGCGACISILTGDGEACCNLVDEKSIAGNAGWSGGRDNFISSRVSRRSWASRQPFMVVTWPISRITPSMRKSSFSSGVMVARSFTGPDMVVDAPTGSGTKLIWIG
jgi:hypothetical protein